MKVPGMWDFRLGGLKCTVQLNFDVNYGNILSMTKLCYLSSALLILNHTSALSLPAHHFWRPHLPGAALAFRVFHLLQLQEATGWEALHSCGGSVLLR